MTFSFLLRGGDGYRDTLVSLGLTPKAAYRVVENWPSPMTLMGATETQLRHMGVTPAQARKVQAATRLARLANEVAPRREIHEVADVVALMGPTMAWSEQELFAVLALDPRGGLIDASIIAMGDSHSVTMSTRSVFRDAVRAMASSIILVHNHPSGNLKPSDQDIMLTHRFARVGHILGIPVVDHVVIARGGKATSLAELGFLANSSS